LSCDALHFIFTAILSVVTYAVASFAGQVPMGDKACLNILLWSPYVIGPTIIYFVLGFVLLLLISFFLFYSPNLSPLAAEIGSGVLGTPAIFNWFRVLAALLHCM